MPLLETALQGAMASYGIDEKKAAEAAEIVVDHLSGITMPTQPTKLRFVITYDGSGGSFTMHTDAELDLSGLCDVIAQSRAWSAHTHCCKGVDEITEIVVELKKE